MLLSSTFMSWHSISLCLWTEGYVKKTTNSHSMCKVEVRTVHILTSPYPILVGLHWLCCCGCYEQKVQWQSEMICTEVMMQWWTRHLYVHLLGICLVLSDSYWKKAEREGNKWSPSEKYTPSTNAIHICEPEVLTFLLLLVANVVGYYHYFSV